MGIGLSGVTGAMVEYALDGLSLRHAAIASNIANATTPGYRPQKVSFEDELAAAAGGSAATIAQLPAATVVSEAPRPGLDARAVLDNEVVQLNRNVLQYQALIRGIEKYTATIGTAINEGRR
ncbi:MAG: flagellar biosynthesis protein FlgB [Rhodocyclales bacterium]|nr:flagellar biosynthesis protein FlgB [Rhodocyclales bacterium]